MSKRSNVSIWLKIGGMRQKNKIGSDGRGVENGQKIYLCAPSVEGDGARRPPPLNKNHNSTSSKKESSDSSSTSESSEINLAN